MSRRPAATATTLLLGLVEFTLPQMQRPILLQETSQPVTDPRVKYTVGSVLLAGVLVIAPSAFAKDISGTPRPDKLVGTAQKDDIHAKAGDDSVRARAGGDDVFGGPGQDLLLGGDDRDFIKGGGGRDRLLGNRGNDQLIGGAQDDVVIGADGHDILGTLSFSRGFKGDDTLRGGPGADLIYDDAGNDVLRGGPGKPGSKSIFYIETLVPGRGADRVYGGADADAVYLTRDGRRDVIRCGPGPDVVTYGKSVDPRDVFFSCEKVKGS